MKCWECKTRLKKMGQPIVYPSEVVGRPPLILTDYVCPRCKKTYKKGEYGRLGGD